MEAKILAVRDKEPSWGGRKIKRYFEDQGATQIPSPSTITAILSRNEKIDEHESVKRQPFKRFEREKPNELWQMDFKGYLAQEGGGYCHPLTVLDAHSRFLVGLRACPNPVAPTYSISLYDIKSSIAIEGSYCVLAIPIACTVGL